MRGIPKVFNTREDWLNTCRYVHTQGDVHAKALLKEKLEALKNSRTVKILKKDAPVLAEEQTQEDFESVDDPGSPFATSELSLAEIDLLISQLGIS